MEKRLLFLLVNIFLLCGGVLAQTKVTGTVVSQEDGEPIIGASVVVAGAAKTGTVTDIDGHFSMEVPAGKKLIIIFLRSCLSMLLAMLPIVSNVLLVQQASRRML